MAELVVQRLSGEITGAEFRLLGEKVDAMFLELSRALEGLIENND